MADEKNYPVYARIFKSHFCAIRSDDTPEDPHRIYLTNEVEETFELGPNDFTAYIEQSEVIE